MMFVSSVPVRIISSIAKIKSGVAIKMGRPESDRTTIFARNVWNKHKWKTKHLMFSKIILGRIMGIEIKIKEGEIKMRECKGRRSEKIRGNISMEVRLPKYVVLTYK